MHVRTLNRSSGSLCLHEIDNGTDRTTDSSMWGLRVLQGKAVEMVDEEVEEE